MNNKNFPLILALLLGLALLAFAQPVPDAGDNAVLDDPSTLTQAVDHPGAAIGDHPTAMEAVSTNPAETDPQIPPPADPSQTAALAADEPSPTASLPTDNQLASAAETPIVHADIIVSNVSVLVPDSTGVERQKALEIAARQALPAALAQMNPPVTGSRADAFITAQGDLTRYVKTVRIIKEEVVPTYKLTADLTFNGPKLYANLGGYVPANNGTPASATVTSLRTTVTETAIGSLPVTPPTPGTMHTWPVQLASGSPAEHARLLGVLNAIPSSHAIMDTITTASASYQVYTPLSLDDLEQVLTSHGLATMPGPATGLRVSY